MVGCGYHKKYLKIAIFDQPRNFCYYPFVQPQLIINYGFYASTAGEY